jgi:hypothetical protein
MAIFKLLDSFSFVKNFKILDFKVFDSGVYYKIVIFLKNGTTLHARKYCNRQERNYSFHWQDQKGNLILRWDNSPHHEQLLTFPHHKHCKNYVEESMEITLEDVLLAIQGQL